LLTDSNDYLAEKFRQSPGQVLQRIQNFVVALLGAQVFNGQANPEKPEKGGVVSIYIYDRIRECLNAKVEQKNRNPCVR
jgi:hypothetical protein